MKKNLLLTLTLLFAVSCNKAELTELNVNQNHISIDSDKLPIDSLSKIAIRVRESFNTSTKSSDIRIKNIATPTELGHVSAHTRSAPNSPGIYVVNFEDNNGFVVLTDDARIENNILALSDNGEISNNEDNPGLSLFFESAQQYLSNATYAIRPKGDGAYLPGPMPLGNWGTVTTNRKQWVYSGFYHVEKVNPMIKVNWGQYEPYNTIVSQKRPGQSAGCTPIAVVMLMSYYKQPTQITSNYYGETVYKIDWDKAIYNNDIIGANIHQLIYHTWHYTRLNAKPQPSGVTPASIDSIQSTLRYYGYSLPGSREVLYDQNIVIADLASKKPVIISGKSGINPRHAWVVDGYILGASRTSVSDYFDNNGNQVGQRVTVQPRPAPIYYLHCNWGGNGKSNGYFAEFKTAEGKIYDSDKRMENEYDFTALKKMVHNIKY